MKSTNCKMLTLLLTSLMWVTRVSAEDPSFVSLTAWGTTNNWTQRAADILLNNNLLIPPGTFDIIWGQIPVPSNRIIKGSKGSILRVNLDIGSSANQGDGGYSAFVIKNSKNVEIKSVEFLCAPSPVAGAAVGHHIICILNSSNCEISQCNFTTTGDLDGFRGVCIGANSSNAITITDNFLTGYWNATIKFYGTNNFICSQNKIIDANDNLPSVNTGTFGIETLFSKFGTISNNIISNCEREAINVNKESKDITISNNVINTTEDGGIVLCSDPEYGPQIPPERISISGNVISNCAGAGISINEPSKNISIVSNILVDNGRAFPVNENPDGHWFSSGIYINGKFITISNNSIISTGNVSKPCKYGIYLKPFLFDPISQGSPSQLIPNIPIILVSNNSYEGLQDNIKIEDVATNDYKYYRHVQYDIREGTILNYPCNIDLAKWQTIGNYTNVVNVAPYTSWDFVGYWGSSYDGLSGNVCAKAYNGGYGRLNLLAKNILSNSNVEVSVMAKVQSGNGGYFEIIYDYGSTYNPSFRTNINSTDWKQYTIRVATTNVSQFLVNFGSNNTGTVLFDNPTIKAIKYQ